MLALLSHVHARVSVLLPVEHFGFATGLDYNLFTYEEMIDYLMKLDKASPMLKMEETGYSPMMPT